MGNYCILTYKSLLNLYYSTGSRAADENYIQKCKGCLEITYFNPGLYVRISGTVQVEAV